MDLALWCYKVYRLDWMVNRAVSKHLVVLIIEISGFNIYVTCKKKNNLKSDFWPETQRRIKGNGCLKHLLNVDARLGVKSFFSKQKGLAHRGLLPAIWDWTNTRLVRSQREITQRKRSQREITSKKKISKRDHPKNISKRDHPKEKDLKKRSPQRKMPPARISHDKELDKHIKHPPHKSREYIKKAAGVFFNPYFQRAHCPNFVVKRCTIGMCIKINQT